MAGTTQATGTMTGHDDIREALAAASKMPWQAEPQSSLYPDADVVVMDAEGYTLGWADSCDTRAMYSAADARLIANAPTWLGELLDENRRLSNLIADLTDDDPCWFDHHGGCQAHGFLSLEPGQICPMREAQDVARALDEGK